MSGYGKRSLSPEDVKEPSAKRQKPGESDTAREGITHEHVTPNSYPPRMAQPQSISHPQATPAYNVLQPRHVFQPQHGHQPQHGFQPQHGHQPQHGFQPRHGFQPGPVARPQPILPQQPISGNNNSSSQRPETDADSGSEGDNEPEEAGPSISSEAKGKRRASSPAPEEPNAKKGPSARSQRRAGMKNPGRDDRERDEVEEIGGQLFWRDPKTGELRKAVYHNDIRAQLIAAASAQGTYTHARKRGTRANDETAFHPEQRDWTPERQHWPRIRGNVLNIYKKAGYKGKYYRKSVERIWEHTDGRVILDRDNHPVRKFPDLPATLSSEVEGWYLEVLTRLDNRILRRDFWARLPHGRDKTGSKPASEDMYGLSALGNRRGRWRTSEGLISWKSRGGSKELNNFLRSTISQESLDRNSNEGGRTLTPEEIKHAEELKGSKKVQQSKRRGRKPAHTSATTEQGVRASTEPESSPGKSLTRYPDPSSPSLLRQPRPLSTLLAGMERAQDEERARQDERARAEKRGMEEAVLRDPLDNAGINDSNILDQGSYAPPADQNAFHPGANLEAGAGLSGDMFDHNIPGFGIITDEDLQAYAHQGWDGVQEQLWASLNNEIWDFTGSNIMGPANTTSELVWDDIPANQNGNPEWYQSGQEDAAQAAVQTGSQIQQQQQGMSDQVHNHAGPSGSTANSDPFSSLFNDQQLSANGADNLQSLEDWSGNNQAARFMPPLVAGTDVQKTTNPGSEILQKGGFPIPDSNKHRQTPGFKAATEFAGRQTNTQTSSGLRRQTSQLATKADGLDLPPPIDLTEDHQDSELERHPDIATASYDRQLFVQICEQVMSELNNDTPTSSHPTGHPTADPAHPASASNPPPAPNNMANQPPSSPRTTGPSSDPAPITPIEASHITPTTRVHHAILWRLFKPTREAFQAAFRDDAWRPYVARDFVPPITEPMSYIEMLDHYSGEFWKVWTARYGFEGEVPDIVRPTLIDDETARALGEVEEGVNGD